MGRDFLTFSCITNPSRKNIQKWNWDGIEQGEREIGHVFKSEMAPEVCDPIFNSCCTFRIPEYRRKAIEEKRGRSTIKISLPKWFFYIISTCKFDFALNSLCIYLCVIILVSNLLVKSRNIGSPVISPRYYSYGCLKLLHTRQKYLTKYCIIYCC